MQYSASHVATMALVLSQNGLRSNLRVSNFGKFSVGACPQTNLVLHAYACMYTYTSDTHATPVLKILAMGLACMH